MVWVYLLRCSDGTFYVGQTSDPLGREKAHNEGRGGTYTALRRPVRVVYSERCESIESAVTRERQLKRWSKEKKLALINGDLKKLKQLSQSHHQRRTTKVRESGKDRE
jgi:predicted GIY-YIG superfamily endonuclease